MSVSESDTASIRLVNVTEELARACQDVEYACFPNADPDDLFGVTEWTAQARTFPEGSFIAIDDATGEVIATSAGIRTTFDFDHPQHTIHEAAGEHGSGNHDPEGDWYYGTDIAVHPDHRGKGIGRMLYDARKQLVRELGLRGIIAGGYLPGFADAKHEVDVETYLDDVVAGRRYDSTLTMQLRNGFEVRGALHDYIEDPKIDSKASLIVWPNPDLA